MYFTRVFFFQIDARLIPPHSTLFKYVVTIVVIFRLILEHFCVYSILLNFHSER